MQAGYQYNNGGSSNGNGNGGGEIGYNGGGSFNDLGEGFEESSLFKGFTSYDAPLVSGSNYDSGSSNIDVRLQDSSYAGASSSSGSFGGASSGKDINLIQGQSQTIDLTGGSAGGKRIVYKPVIKQGEPIITKNFYVVRNLAQNIQ
jgi:hypothetical protein